MARFTIRQGDDLSGADLSNFDFYKHYGIPGLNGGQGANLQNCKFQNTNFKTSKHYHSDFRGADLTEANFSDAKCFETLFGGHEKVPAPAILLRTNFTNAYLGGSALIGVDASCAIFVQADLQYVNFSYADLRGANFSGANLTNTNFYAANISEIITDEDTVFTGAIGPDGTPLR